MSNTLVGPDQSLIYINDKFYTEIKYENYKNNSYIKRKQRINSIKN